MQRKYLYRACCAKEVLSLLSQRKISSINFDFVSLSYDLTHVEMEYWNNESEYLLIFDANELERQGSVHVIYDTELMQKDEPQVVKHVLASNTYGTTLQDYSHEQEVSIEEIKLDNNKVLVDIKRFRNQPLHKRIIDQLGYLITENLFG